MSCWYNVLVQKNIKFDYIIILKCDSFALQYCNFKRIV